MNLLEKIIVSKGKRYDIVHTMNVSLQDVIDCFAWSHRRDYIGINWNLFKKGTEGYKLMEEFFDFVAKKAKRWWTPYWFLNWLYLFGKDHSIVRMRSLRLSTWHTILTNGITIRDVKTKWGSLRIYGSFTQEIQDKLDELETKIDPMLEAY